jgi:predicted nucleic-acid-binding Zn-ribbon protein
LLGNAVGQRVIIGKNYGDFTGDPTMEIVFIVFIPVVIIMLIVWGTQKQNLGTIRCNRCGYTGLSKGAWRPGRGMTPVCGKCGSDNWVSVH